MKKQNNKHLKKPNLEFDVRDVSGLIEISKEEILRLISKVEELTAENATLLTDVDALNEHICTCNEMYDNSIKENLEINEANTRLTLQVEHLSNERDKLLTDLDKSKEFAKSFDESWNIMDRRISELQKDNKVFEQALDFANQELTSIKSKWWYKLMTWGW